MGLFRVNTDKQSARDLETVRAARETLAQRLAAAQAAVTESRAAAQRLAADAADDAALDRAEASLRAGQDRIATLTAALTESDNAVATIEAQIADAADQKHRAETAVTLETMATALEADAKLFDTAIAALANSATAAGTLFLDARGLEGFTRLARDQVPEAVKLITGLLRGRIAAVLNGSASPKMPSAEVAIVAKVVPPPPTMTVFVLQHVKWIDANGNLRKQCAHTDCGLPLSVAERALKIGAAVKVTDAARKQFAGKTSPIHPDPWRCVNLDDAVDLVLREEPPAPYYQPNVAKYKAGFST
jgi:hypothetical protein